MRHSAFDDLTRRLADRPALSRRTLLQALGLAGAGALDGERAAAQEATPAPSDLLRADPFSFEQIAFDLAYDIQRIFAVVAENIAYDAYDGALRGAKGTLAGLAGNSVDQALLLAELLTQSEVTVRFATGALTPEAEAALLGALDLSTAEATERAARQRLAPGPAFAPPAAQAATTVFDPNAPAIVAAVDALAARNALAQQQAESAIGMITGALAGAGIALPEPVVALPRSEIEQHVWVQIASGPNWIDLDPSIPDAVAGTAYATNPTILPALPDERYHRLRFRVEAESVAGGSTQQADLLAYEARAADMAGLPLAFVHPRAGAFEGTGLAIVQAVAGTVTYYPALAIGDDIVVDQPVVVGNGEGVTNVLGSSAIDGETLAERLYVEIVSPGADPVTISRTVFDRVPPEQRLSGTIDLASIPPVTMVDIEGVGSIYPPMVDLVTIEVVGATTPAISGARGPRRPDTLAQFGALGDGYHLLRDDLLAGPGLAHGYRYYPDAPNLVAHIGTLTDPGSADGGVRVTADLWYRHLAAAPLRDGASDGHPGIVQGVYAHVAERVQLDPSWSAAIAPEENRPDAQVASAGAVFEAAAAQGIGIGVIKPGANTLTLGTFALSPAERLLIDDALARGLVVILPQRPVSVNGVAARGWWLVDPATGYVFDQMADGRGASMAEYAQRVAQFLYGPLPKFRTMGCAVAFIAIAGAIVVAVGATIQVKEAQNAGSSVLGAFIVMEGSHATALGTLLGPLAGCR